MRSENKIYLKEKVTDSEQQTSNANKRNISGRVVDEKGEPIIGASVMVQGSSLGTITNVDGRYTLANVPETVRLQSHTSDILRLITLLLAEICLK